jgi:opacity protein-like surface antigen
MKNIIWILCAVVTAVPAFATTTTPLLSSREYTVGAGDIETSFFFEPSIVSVNGNSNNSLTFQAGANLFMDDVFAPGVEFEWTAFENADNRFRLLPNVKAYLPNRSRFLPYMQAGLGFTRAFDENFLTLTLGPGINYMLSNTVAIGGQLRYDLNVGTENLHEVSIPVQFAIYFRY